MDLSFDIPGMTESHRGLICDCFKVAFSAECVPSMMSDALLAALLRLRIRMINNFGLYVLANPDTELTAEPLHESLVPLMADAISRLQYYGELSANRAALVTALSECRTADYDSDEVLEEIMRFVAEAESAICFDESSALAVVRLAGTIPLSAPERVFALSILRGWISSMAADGSWTDLSDMEALGRCHALADAAIPGYVVRAEQIDSCYLRYVMKEEHSDLSTEILRIAARCAHYTDIEVDYADADIAFLTDALNGDIPAEMRIDAYTALFDVLLQLYALDLMETIDFDHSPGPETPGMEYPRA